MRYDELNVYKRSHGLVLSLYKTVESFPKNEQFGLTSQIKRASVSVPANIAEGNSRQTTKDYIHFLYISRGSLGELRYLILLSKDLGFIEQDKYKELITECDEIVRMLNNMINSLKRKNKT